MSGDHATKRERDGETKGIGLGLIVRFRYVHVSFADDYESWLEKRSEWCWDLSLAHRGLSPEDWPLDACDAVAWLLAHADELRAHDLWPLDDTDDDALNGTAASACESST